MLFGKLLNSEFISVIPNKEYKTLRHNIYLDQHRLCGHCGRWTEFDQFHIHHKKTRGAGGTDDKSNLIGLCWQCHRKVHDGNVRLLAK